MKLINLAEQAVDISHVLELALEGPVVLLAADGREYVLAEADDFDREVEQLRNRISLHIMAENQQLRFFTKQPLNPKLLGTN